MNCSCSICCCEIYVPVRLLRYILLRNVFIMYGSYGICCCEMYVYSKVAALYAIAKCMYNVR